MKKTHFFSLKQLRRTTTEALLASMQRPAPPLTVAHQSALCYQPNQQARLWGFERAIQPWSHHVDPRSSHTLDLVWLVDEHPSHEL